MAFSCRYLLWIAAFQYGLLVAADGDSVEGAELSRHFLNASSSTSTYTDTYIWGPLPDPSLLTTATTTSASSSSDVSLVSTTLSTSQFAISTTLTTSSQTTSEALSVVIPSSSSSAASGASPPLMLSLPTVASTPPSPVSISVVTSVPSTPLMIPVPTVPPPPPFPMPIGTGPSGNGSATGRSPYGNSSISWIIYTITTDYGTIPLTSSCSTLSPGQEATSWIIMPNTTTTTITLKGNQSMTWTKTPEFTPPTYCTSWTLSWPAFTASFSATTTMTTAAESSYTAMPFQPSATSAYTGTTTIITTSKNPVTVFTTVSIPLYGQNTDPGSSAVPSSYIDTYIWGPLPDPTLTETSAPSYTDDGSSPPVTNIIGPGTSNTVTGGMPPGNTDTPGSAPTVTGGIPPGNTDTPGSTPTATDSPSITTSNTNTPGSAPTSNLGSVVIIGPGGSPTTVKAGAPHTSNSPSVISIDPVAPYTTVYNGGGTNPGPITQGVGGVTVIVSSTQVVIGDQTVSIGGSDTTVTTDGETFTINPSQVIGPSVIINVPSSAGGQFILAPTPTTVQGVSIDINRSTVVIAGTSYAIGAGAPMETIVAKGQTITIGTAGVILSATTITPPGAQPTNVVIVDGEAFSAIGSNTAVIGGKTFTYSPGLPPRTEVYNGETITIGPQGVSFEGTTLGGIANPTGTELGIAGGISLTEIGSTLAIVDGQTLTFGPQASTTTLVISGQTVVVGSTGIIIGGATLTAPFNVPTQAITAGGITFSEVGSSLAVIGGKTFTFGPGATTVSDVYDGQTISIGPSGIGFATTTFTAASATFTAGSPSHTKNGGTRGIGGLGIFGVLGICIIIVGMEVIL